ncbi:MAG: COG1470 family protein [Methermicoccaceae archaeon]
MKSKVIIVACLLMAALVVGCVQQPAETQQGTSSATEPSGVEEVPAPIPAEEPVEMGERMRGAASELSIWMPYSTHYVKVGGSSTFTMMVRNNAEQQRTIEFVPVMYEQSSYSSSVSPEWVSISPSKLVLAAGESAELAITVSPPSGTSTGSYQGMLALRSASFPEQLRYYSIYTYEPLSEAITKECSVSSGSEGILAVVSWREYEGVNADTVIELMSPSGSSYSGTETTEISGWMNEGYTATERDSIEHTTSIYVKSPEAGTWTLKMKPEVAVGMSFRIILNPTSSTLDNYGVEG